MPWLTVKWVAAAVLSTVLTAGRVTVGLKAAESGREAARKVAAPVAPDAPRTEATAVAPRPQPGPVAGPPEPQKASDASLPLGHRNFYPSPERPVGERGDWTGLFPGAKDVALEWDHRTGKNIVWKCPLPNWSNSSPIVVGKKAFVGSEPDELVCIDTETGKVLWTRSVMIDQFIPEADRAAVRTALREVDDQAVALDNSGWFFQVWLKAIAPAEDPVVSATAQRIAEVWRKAKEKGITIPLADEHDTIPAEALVSRASSEIMKQHGMVRLSKTKKTPSAQDPFLSGVIACQSHMGFTMPTPVSDGAHVWYKSSLGAMACLDLDGKVLWSKRSPTVGGTVTDMGPWSGCGSPMLIGDRLFYQENGNQVVCAEKLTGKEVWRKDRVGSGRGSGGIAPMQVGGRDFVLFPSLFILDAATGDLAAKLPFPPDDVRRSHIVAGNSVIYATCSNVCRADLALEGERLTVKEVWRNSPKLNQLSWATVVAYAGNIYWRHHVLKYFPFEATGSQAPKKITEVWRKKLVIGIPKGMKKMGTAFLDYAAPSVAEGHGFWGDDGNGMFVMKLAGEKSEAVNNNFMDLGIRSNPFFQGNRMYVRSFNYLYCIAPAPVSEK